MKKRMIFDVEKIGFGDEAVSSQATPISHENEVKQQPMKTNPVRTGMVRKPEAILSRPTPPKAKPLPPLEKVAPKSGHQSPMNSHYQVSAGPKPKISTRKKEEPVTGFQSVEFISPITGRRMKKPQVVHVAHGKYNWLRDSFLYEESEQSESETGVTTNEALKKLVDEVLVSREDFDELETEVNHWDESKEVVAVEEHKGVTVLDEGAPMLEENIKATLSEENPLKNNLKEASPKEPVVLKDKESTQLAVEEVLTLLQEEESGASLVDSLLMEGQVEEQAAKDEGFYDELLETVQVQEDEKVYYEIPSLSLLDSSVPRARQSEDWIMEKMAILEQTFINFGVKVRLTGEYTQGPTVTQIEIQPESGTKVSKVLGLCEDLKLSLSAEELRVEPIAGKNTIGVEIPNPEREAVSLKDVLSRPEFMLHESPLYIGLGKDIAGVPTYADILTMPHGLIAGQTGSGKSVCINTLLISLLYKASPEDVRLMLIDPKRVELAPYNDIPHLVTPVITDENKAAQALKWAVNEMERRYDLFAKNGVRDVKAFNERRHEFDMDYMKIPYLLIVIDELADLMMVAAQAVEDYIMRLTQKARAAGIHLIVATQRPTVDVITGTIKSNIPSRLAFTVAQANDSRVILDANGAQSLLGRGDMLWTQSSAKLKRVQGAYISSEEIDRVVTAVKSQQKPKYLIADQFLDHSGYKDAQYDPLLKDAMALCLDQGHATISMLQRKMGIGYNKAARIVEALEENSWIGSPQGAMRQREIKITKKEFEQLFDETRT